MYLATDSLKILLVEDANHAEENDQEGGGNENWGVNGFILFIHGPKITGQIISLQTMIQIFNWKLIDKTMYALWIRM